MSTVHTTYDSSNLANMAYGIVISCCYQIILGYCSSSVECYFRRCKRTHRFAHRVAPEVLYVQSMSRFTGLPCLPLFFFRATPSPRFTGGMPVYRGGLFFHARGAPPAAAHSHTRCCTQHNTTRWVLRAAANTCLHTMFSDS